VVIHGITIGPDKAEQVANAQNDTVQLANMATFRRVGICSPLRRNHRLCHPVVYVEWGGHEFWPTSAWDYNGAAKHNGIGQYPYFGTPLVDLTVDSGTVPDEVRLVTTFLGFWSANGGSEPPQGPILHCQWYWDPVSYPASTSACPKLTRSTRLFRSLRLSGPPLAMAAFTIPAQFLLIAVIWHWMDPAHNWIAYCHNVRWHWILAVIKWECHLYTSLQESQSSPCSTRAI
jgi:hypothetical protein